MPEGGSDPGAAIEASRHARVLRVSNSLAYFSV